MRFHTGPVKRRLDGAVGMQLLQPATERVGVQNESPCRFNSRPLQQSHDLEELKSIGWGIMRALLGRDSFPFLAEDGQFPLEQRGIPGESIQNCGQT